MFIISKAVSGAPAVANVFKHFSAVNKYGHLYQTLHETKEAVINFMSADIYDKCMATIRYNQFVDDEIAAADLTAVKADMVNAPMIEECFLNLECRFKWEKEIAEGDDYVLICLEIVNMHIDEHHLDENDFKRLHSVFFESTDIEDIFSSIERSISEAIPDQLNFTDKYKVDCGNVIGVNNGAETSCVEVVTFPNTKDIITMYPVIDTRKKSSKNDDKRLVYDRKN